MRPARMPHAGIEKGRYYPYPPHMAFATQLRSYGFLVHPASGGHTRAAARPLRR